MRLTTKGRFAVTAMIDLALRQQIVIERQVRNQPGDQRCQQRDRDRTHQGAACPA